MSVRQQYTLTQVQAMVVARLQQSPFWTAAEQTKLINEALRQWSCLTGYWKTRMVLTTLSNLSPYYNIAGALTFGMRVEFNGSPLIQSSLTNWDKGYPQWEGRPSVPQEWAPVGISLVAIRPADAVGNNSLVLDGVSAAPVLKNTGDFIDIGAEELNTVIGYTQYLAAFKEGGQEFENALPLYQAFLKAAAVKNEKLTASAIFRRAMGIDNDLAGMRPRRAKPLMQPVGAR
jgi:hypothetical protein